LLLQLVAPLLRLQLSGGEGATVYQRLLLLLHNQTLLLLLRQALLELAPIQHALLCNPLLRDLLLRQ